MSVAWTPLDAARYWGNSRINPSTSLSLINGKLASSQTSAAVGFKSLTLVGSIRRAALKKDSGCDRLSTLPKMFWKYSNPGCTHWQAIAPYLSYGLIAWCQACKSYLDKLLKLQKRALRFIYFSDHNQHAIPLFSDASILPLHFSHYELTTNLMFDIRHRNAPRNIRDLFQDISNIHSYNTRSSASNNFYTQSSRLSIQLNSFSRIGITILH